MEFQYANFLNPAIRLKRANMCDLLVQYLLNSEIYPLRIRAISSSLVMCFHFGKLTIIQILLEPR